MFQLQLKSILQKFHIGFQMSLLQLDIPLTSKIHAVFFHVPDFYQILEKETWIL